MSRLKELSSLVQHGENRQAVALADKLLTESETPDRIISAISDGLKELRNKCTIENFQLLDVLLASRAMVEVVDECLAHHLEGVMDNAAENYEQNSTNGQKRTLVIGTIQGDVHDLGKHVVATLCRFNDLRVVNLGKDVPVENFIEAAFLEKADFVGVSSLMTVCLEKVKEIKPALKRRGLGDVQVIGGGSAVVQSSAEILNLDYKAVDAFDGLNYLSRNESNEKITSRT